MQLWRIFLKFSESALRKLFRKKSQQKRFATVKSLFKNSMSLCSQCFVNLFLILLNPRFALTFKKAAAKTLRDSYVTFFKTCWTHALLPLLKKRQQKRYAIVTSLFYTFSHWKRPLNMSIYKHCQYWCSSSQHKKM